MQNSYTKFHANHTILVTVLGTTLFTLPCTLPKLKIIKYFVLYIICTEIYACRIKHVESMGKMLFTALSKECFSLQQLSQQGKF